MKLKIVSEKYCSNLPDTFMNVVDENGNTIFIMDDDDDIELARRIVTAVNCHDDLLEACEAVRDWLDRTKRSYTKADYGNLVSAIAKAKGES